MKPVLIVQHIASNHPGFFREFLRARGIPFELVRIHEHEALPEGTEAYSGLCFMGGTMSVNDPLPWIEQACRLIREAHEREQPVIGHCLGGQLISKALGGRVDANPVHEIGWHPMRPVASPAAGEWLGEFPEPLVALNWHFETFSLPEGAELLMESDYCPNQAFVLGRSLALQFHVEATEDIVTDWVSRYAFELSPSPSIHSAEEIAAGIDTHLPRALRLAEHLYARWARALT